MSNTKKNYLSQGYVRFNYNEYIYDPIISIICAYYNMDDKRHTVPFTLLNLEMTWLVQGRDTHFLNVKVHFLWFNFLTSKELFYPNVFIFAIKKSTYW